MAARSTLLLLAALVLCTAAAMGCGRAEQPDASTPPASAATSPAMDTAEDERTVRDADQRLAGAFENRNTETVDRLLDADFTWITAAGVLQSRASTLTTMPKPAITGSGDYTLEARRYGASLAVVQRHNSSILSHALHVWVRRSDGWRLLHIAEVMEGERVVYGGTMIGAADCINPCQVVPFIPATPAEKAVMEAWQLQQSGPEEWARHVPDDNVARTSNGTYTKADRVTVQTRQMLTRAIVVPSPLTWARIWEFGDTALMLALQPRAAGKPFWGSRVFELRDGTWMMAESYQVTIRDMPPF